MSISKTLIEFIVTGCYSGKSPRVPGTCGTLVAVILAYLLFLLFPLLAQPVPSLVLAGSMGILAIWSVNVSYSLGLFGKTEDDPQQVVIDEVAGYFVTIAALGCTLPHLIVGFVLFRVFDIWKPFPVHSLERYPRGWGIVLDDLAAGIYANLCTQLLFYVY